MIGNTIRYYAFTNPLNRDESRSAEHLVVDAFTNKDGVRIYKVEVTYTEFSTEKEKTIYKDVEAYKLQKIVKFANK